MSAWLAAASATDTVDGHVSVDDNAPAVLPIGDTVVTFTATDHSGNTATAQSTLTVVTGAAPPANLDTTPPGEVQQPEGRAPATGSIDLTWALPTDADFDHVAVSRSNSNPGSETVVYSGVAKHLKDAKLENGIEYRYVFVTFDKTGNRSTGSGRPGDAEAGGSLRAGWTAPSRPSRRSCAGTASPAPPTTTCSSTGSAARCRRTRPSRGRRS